MTTSRLFPIFLFFICARFLGAQPGNPAQADTASLRIQYEQMLEASNRFQRFKVVREDFLEAFITNVSDSVRAYTDEVGSLKTRISDQEAKIQEQATTIGARDATITELSEEKDSVSLLGLSLDKATYNLIVWTTIVGLLAALLFAIARMRFAVGRSREARLANEKTTAELEQSRKNRLEVEQKLRRQLQDERNKRS